MDKPSAEAFVEDGAIVIRVPLNNLPQILDGGFMCNAYEKRYRVTDAQQLTEEVISELNREDEEGTTPIHRLFDKAISDAIDGGSLGVEEHEDQEL